MTDKMTRM